MAVASDRVDATLTGFTRWAKAAPQKLSGDPDADVEELRLVLAMLRDHVGVDDPADLGPGDLDELLLQVYPRKVTVLDAEGTTDTVPALRDLLAFGLELRAPDVAAGELLAVAAEGSPAERLRAVGAVQKLGEGRTAEAQR